MKVLVSGSHGLVGSHLIPFMSSKGHEVVSLVRSYPEPGQILWHPEKGEINKVELEGVDAVVHLAGESIASGRWTAAKKTAIRDSRVQSTRLLSDTLANLKKPPKVFVSGSAIGFYGNRNSEILTEESAGGTGFLAGVCTDWEAATAVADLKGIRVAHLRTGVVLSTKGGALSKMLPPFQIGMGGRLGSGNQYMSWISLEDLVGAIYHIISHDELRGPVNAVAPGAVTNDEFTVALGSALKRPTICPVPGFAAHLLLGEMADELLLSSTLVKPAKLQSSGYAFRHPELRHLLCQLLGAA